MTPRLPKERFRDETTRIQARTREIEQLRMEIEQETRELDALIERMEQW
jgi:hypothetical protein